MNGYLRDRGLTVLTMVGLATDFCVHYSAVDAALLGFDVTVDKTACRGIDLEGSMQEALESMQKSGVTIALP